MLLLKKIEKKVKSHKLGMHIIASTGGEPSSCQAAAGWCTHLTVHPVSARQVSAPPGYSEHHTGYALDVGDADRSDTHLEYGTSVYVGVISHHGSQPSAFNHLLSE